MKPVILFAQLEQDIKSRTYYQLSNVIECITTVWGLFQLKTMEKRDFGPPTQDKYEQLMSFIDRLPDLACLIYREDIGKYEARNKAWIKEQFLNLIGLNWVSVRNETD